jgi:hypothetical protein
MIEKGDVNAMQFEVTQADGWSKGLGVVCPSLRVEACRHIQSFDGDHSIPVENRKICGTFMIKRAMHRA